jgi:hypothetical protein
MIKRWMALLFVMSFVVQACALPASAPTSIAPQPSEIISTLLPSGTAPATLAVPTLAGTSSAKATKVVVNTAIAPAPTTTFTPASPTPTQKIPTKVPAAPTPIPMKYGLQPGTPAAVAGFVHSDLGCNWMGIGGQVFALDSTPVKQLVVELGGTLNGQPISQLSLTGTATQWGPGGFEFTLANHPIDSSGTLWMRLLDLNADPISNRIYFTTYSDCTKNTILVNLTQLVPNMGIQQYLPLVGR